MQQRRTHASYIIKSKDQHAEYVELEPETKMKKPPQVSKLNKQITNPKPWVLIQSTEKYVVDTVLLYNFVDSFSSPNRYKCKYA